MPAITLFSSGFTGAGQIAEKIASVTGYRIIDDRELIEVTHQQYGTGRHELEKVIYQQSSAFTSSARKKACAIAAFKSVLADFLMKEDGIYLGYLGRLVPRNISLQVLVIAKMESRMRHLLKNEGKLGREALQQIRREDKSLYGWAHYLEEKENFDIAAYDVVVPSDKQDIDSAARQVIGKLSDSSENPDDRGKVKADIADFALAARVAFAVAQKGYDPAVIAAGNRVTLTISKNVIMLSRLERKLKKIAAGVPGVKEVCLQVNKDYYRANICNPYDYKISFADIRSHHEREYAALYQSAAQETLRPDKRMSVIQPRIQA
jgi:cytidylate kinase